MLFVHKISFFTLAFTISLIPFVDRTLAEESNDLLIKKPLNVHAFTLEHNPQEKTQFLQQFPKNNKLNIEEKFIFSQHNHEETDFGEPIHDSQIFWKVLFEQLEYQVNENESNFNWDVNAWVGGDYQKLVIKSEGDISLDDGNGEAELQLLYSKQISPYFDLQTGLRYDQLYGDQGNGRGFAVIGIEGLAPYFVEVEGALFISHEGDISARFEAESEFLLSQRVVLQPMIETNIAIQQVEEFGVGSGFNNLELGLRLRYEISRELAPYIGVSWEKLFGQTAEFAKEEGESTDEVKFVTGLRLMF
jgi:copper resistance protein B